MQKLRCAILLGSLAFVMLLAGCSLFAGEQITPPPPPEAALQSSPMAGAGTVTEAVSKPVAGAAQGEVLFVRDGQLWATGTDGAGERVLTTLPPGSALRYLTISPGGQYAAFTVSSQQVMVLDLSLGQPTVVAEMPSSSFDALIWSAGGDALIYHEAAFDEQGLPSASRIWQAAMPPGTPPVTLLDTDLASDPALYQPGFVLGPDLLAVRRMAVGSDDPGSWLLLAPSSGTTVPLVDGFGLWNISSDQTKALLFNQAEAMAPNVPLYLGTIPQPPGAVIDIRRISAEDAVGIFRSARFAPDGVRIVALQVTQTEQGENGLAVLLQPGADGTYQITALAPQQGVNDMALAWHGEDGVVVQRWLTGEEGPSLWLLPLDGSPGRMLASGEMPLVVGDR
ncbi:MAG: hypothetical protein JXB30_01485 [Anaerolineae bacterium]|nr:hypothetical protein [Anaerolineae bacterium]